MFYCDRFSKLLPNTPRIKCLTDSGYFVDVNKNLHKGKGFETIYKALVTLHLHNLLSYFFLFHFILSNRQFT
ncbi:hypothetical protein H5410_040195 [Solanum commersonii]|uniref:Pectin acetylesterase n=1 Tax=Solanum commersonii TaxID=4109 RepID=A0A9J5XN75_SOLCO|nr:hypothetical protein H5410_040195 [Solanum commersonii]